MKLETSMVLKRLLRQGPLVGLLIVAMAAAGACVAEELGKESDFLMEELAQTGTLSAPSEFDGEVLLYEEDVPALLEEISPVDAIPDKREVIRDYLKRQIRLNCILKKIEESAGERKDLNCEGKLLVKKAGTSGLLEDINSLGSEPAKREFVRNYLFQWDEEKRVEQVMEGLAQMKRTRGIPLFGQLVKAIHNFPIVYEGDVLVPKEDLSDLLRQYRSLGTEEARREMVEDYLVKRTSP